MKFRLFRRARLQRIWLLLLGLFIGFFVYVHNYLEFRRNDKEVIFHMSENAFGYEPHLAYFKEKGQGRRIRYVEMGCDSLPVIMFIHGAPSSISFWSSLLTDSTLLSRAKLMAVDRPGYGYSGFGRAEKSVKKQAAIIAQLLKRERPYHKTIILHGSSYGGTVAARIAMDYPELVDGLLLQSASVAPGEEKTYDASYVTNHWSLRWLLPGSFKVANDEKLSHREQLEAMAPLWDRITAHTIILHGDADGLIYPVNGLYARAHLTHAASVEFHMEPGRGHDLLWTRPTLLVSSLHKLLDLTQPGFQAKAPCLSGKPITMTIPKR